MSTSIQEISIARSQVLSNLLTDLAQFTGDDESTVVENMQMAEQLMRGQWCRRNPQTIHDVNSFYATDATMPYRLTWQLLSDPTLIKVYATLPDLALKYVWRTVLDYDTEEIGTITISTVKEKYSVASVASGCEGVKKGDILEFIR